MSQTTPQNATFVAGTNKRLPTIPSADGPLERIMRLAFHIQEDDAAVVPTVVTRDSGAAGESAHVPQQVFMVAPLASGIPRTRPRWATAPPSGRRADGRRSDADGAERSRGVVPAASPNLDVAGVSLPGYAPGYKDRNQDAALLLDTFLSNRQQLLAVFDGHGPEGHRVSEFAKRNLPYTLLTQLVEEGKGGGDGDVHRSSGSRDGNGNGHGAAGGWAGPVAATTDGCDADVCGGGPLPRALWRAVTSLDQQLEESGIDVVNSGTTAALCHVHGRRVTAAWVGDSRMLLGLPAHDGGTAVAAIAPQQTAAWGKLQGGAATSMSMGSGGAADAPGARRDADMGSSSSSSGSGKGGNGRGDGGGGGGDGGGSGGWRVAWSSTDHKPELPSEAQRIQAAGGRVARSVGREGPVGPYRVWFQDQAYPGLAMSRALGDLPSRHIGITCTPSCASLRLPDSGPAVLVLASDGVWELLSNEQVLRLAAGAGSAAEAASRLVQQSRRAWVKEYGGSYVDDITALVMRFDMPPRKALPQ